MDDLLLGEQTHVTVVRFSGGEILRVGLSVPEVQKLLQRAIAEGVMLELQAPDGQILVINPQQVQYLQTEHGEATAQATDAGRAVPA